MTKRNRRYAAANPGARPATLADVATALKRARGLSATRVRDLVSAVKRVAALLGNEPAALAVEISAISAKLAAVNPVALGITAKRLANIRSDFLAALKASRLISSSAFRKSPLSDSWVELFERHSTPRARIGLSRLARYANGRGLPREAVNDQLVHDFIAAVREQSFCPRPKALHRQVALIWNKIAADPALGLTRLTVPSFRTPNRIDWNILPDSLTREVAEYLAWCAASDPFATDTRPRALSPRTLRLLRDQLHAAITALVESGINPIDIKSLGDLVRPTHFLRILRHRLDRVSGAENSFNYFLARALVQMAREWVKVDPRVLTELKRFSGKMPKPASGLTDKNKRALRQFDDPAVLRRLYRLPEPLWAEVRRGKPNRLRLAKAQAALAIAIPCYMPVRPGNLARLEFDTHLFMREGAGATSTLELPDHEVKNRTELAFDIPPVVARMLIEYRDRLAPKIIGHRPTRVFVNVDGTPKNQAAVADLIKTYLRRRAGIVLTPHQFRHLSAKVVLDKNPGEFETVKQFLGHKSIKTTVGAYAGIDSRRASTSATHRASSYS